MKYYMLEPEVSGSISESAGDWAAHPPRIDTLRYEFEGWQGGEIVTSLSYFLVTDALKEDLERIEPSGCEFDAVEVSTSDTFEELKMEGYLPAIPPDHQLPKFHWLKITGAAMRDDFGQTGIERAYSIVVSERVLSVMKQHNMSVCLIEEHSG